jgi:hypothetical protein
MGPGSEERSLPEIIIGHISARPGSVEDRQADLFKTKAEGG